MLKRISLILCIAMLLNLFISAAAFAREGDNGYEGGIASGDDPDKVEMNYQEVCFVSGEPVIFKGSLTVKKSLKQDNINTVYTYSLENADIDATLRRTVALTTKRTKKDNGQTVEETSLPANSRLNENIIIGDRAYRLRSYDFSRSSVIDEKPSINYYAGTLGGVKTYQVTGGGGTGTVTVRQTGEFYGYDQYWGTSEVQVVDYTIEAELRNGDQVDKWGGTANIKLSSGITQRFEYIESIPDQISFSGRYVQRQNNESVMEYTSRLPEFDSKGISTDTMLERKGSLKLESFPTSKDLPVAGLSYLRGHWAEKDIKLLYGLEVFRLDGSIFKPEQYMSRSEFASAITAAAKEVPADPALSTRAVRTSRTQNQELISPFGDVSVENAYFHGIESAYKRGLMEGGVGGKFYPNSYITIADALLIFIRAVGLESLAPNPAPVTTFRDNDKIPSHARAAVYVAERIGIIQPDSKGNINVSGTLTKAQAAQLISKFIEYMQDGIRRDYRERIINF